MLQVELGGVCRTVVVLLYLDGLSVTVACLGFIISLDGLVGDWGAFISVLFRRALSVVVGV